MLKLCGIGSFDVSQTTILLDDSARDKALHLDLLISNLDLGSLGQGKTYASQISFCAKAFKVPTTERDCPEVLSNSLMQLLCRGQGYWRIRRPVNIQAVAIDTNLVLSAIFLW
jgi:hypothetical protein